MDQKFLNPDGLPGEKYDLDCINDMIITLRCCLSKETGKLALKQLYGIECSNQVKQDLRLRQILLKQLMNVEWDELENECLTNQELVNILNYLKLKCKECSPFNVN